MKSNYEVKISALCNGVVIHKADFRHFPIVFGRSKDCHLSLPQYSFLSKQHGNIIVDNGELVVSDLHSTNGIYVNNKLVFQSTFEKKGEFAVGHLLFKIELNALEPTVSRTQISSHPEPTPKAKPEPEPILKPIVPGKVSSKLPATVPMKALAQLEKTIRKNDDQYYEPYVHKNTKDLSLQGTVFWGQDVFEVRQFQRGDELILGPNDSEPIYLPTFLERLHFGSYVKGRACFRISKRLNWKLYHMGKEMSFEEAKQKQTVKEDNINYNIELDFNNSFLLELLPDIRMHVCYVEQPRPLIRKTWVENREEFKKAISVSGVVHLLICILCLILAPKSHGPKVDDVPERYARLLVEPPKQVFVMPPIEKPPEPEKKIVEEKPPEAPPKKEKIKVVKKIEKVRKEVVERRVVKPTTDSVSQVVQSKPAPPPPPVKTQQEVASEKLMASLGALPTTMAQNIPNVKINNTAPAKNGMQPNQMLKMVKAQNGSMPVSGVTGTGDSALAKASQGGYQTGGVAGKAGKRAVAGGLVGVPKFNIAKGPQGLNESEIQKVVNQHVAEIQQCYERALFQDSSVSGRVQYEWNISPQGVVGSASVKRSEVGNGDFLNTCVLGIIKKMKFPTATNGEPTQASIGFPFGRN